MTVFISGPIPRLGHGAERFSRILSLNSWMQSVSRTHNFGFLDNFNLFWSHPALYRTDGIHPNFLGSKLLTDNIRVCSTNSVTGLTFHSSIYQVSICSSSLPLPPPLSPSYNFHYRIPVICGRRSQRQSTPRKPSPPCPVTVSLCPSIPPIPSPSPIKFGLLNVRSINNKSFLCNDFITSNNLDFFILNETWLTQGDCTSLIEATPPDYIFLNQPRLSGKGGGVAAIFRKSFKCAPCFNINFTSFEHLGFIITCKEPVFVLTIYRPFKPNNIFIHEFSELLSQCMALYDKVLILGDFNIHVCCSTQPFATDFINTIDSFKIR